MANHCEFPLKNNLQCLKKWSCFLFTCFLTSLYWQQAFAQAEVSPVPQSLLDKLLKSKVDTNRIQILMEIGNDHLQFSQVPKRHLDSAMKFADRAIALSILLHKTESVYEGYILKGYTYIRKNDFVNGKVYFMKAINHYHQTGAIAKEAETRASLGDLITPDSKTNDDMKIGYYRQAQSLYKKVGKQLESIEVLKKIADVYLNQRNLPEAEKLLLQVVSEYKAANFKNLHYTYDLLAGVARLKANLRDQLYYRLLVIKSMEAAKDSVHAMDFYGSLAGTYASLGMLKKAEFYYRKAIQSSRSQFYYFYYFRFTAALTDNLIAQNRVGDALDILQKAIKKQSPVNLQDRIFIDEAFGHCYQKLGRAKVAENYYRHSVVLSDSAYALKSINGGLHFSNIMNLVDLFISVGDFASASLYLRKAKLLPKVNLSPISLANYELSQYQTDSASKHFETAIGHLKRYGRLKDSIYNIEQTKKVDELIYKSETEQKDRELVLQKGLVKQSVLVRNLVIVGLCMLLLLLAILYNRYRLKQRSNLLLQKQRNEIDEQNHSLQYLNHKQNTLLTEKEWLLREIHHRVKNNLQTSISLLNMQSAHTNNNEALSAIRDSQRRMFSMSLIHQRLYQSENMTLIDMHIYINELIVYLKESFNEHENIEMDVSIDNINLDVAQALPLGLITNEAVTNAIKYAFPGNNKGVLKIILIEKFDNIISLIIEDNGIGFPLDQYKVQNSLGIKLMRGLADQVQGHFDLQSSSGTSITVKFSKNLMVS
jgi:two-component sensor histidine kinase